MMNRLVTADSFDAPYYFEKSVQLRQVMTRWTD